MFGLNLKPLLMQPPVKGFVTMGLDPGYRNGCKVAVVDGTGKVLDTAVVCQMWIRDRPYVVYRRRTGASRNAAAICLARSFTERHRADELLRGL